MDKKRIANTLAALRKRYPATFIGGSYGLGIEDAKDVDFVIPVTRLGLLRAGRGATFIHALKELLPDIGPVEAEGAAYKNTQFLSLRAGEYNFLFCLPEYFTQHQRSHTILEVLAARGVDVVRDKEFRIIVHEIVRGEYVG